MSSLIHPTAVIADSATLAEGVQVGPYAVVEEGAVIGENCILEPFAVVKNNTRMGKGNHIHSHAVVGGLPQHIGDMGENSYVEMGDNNVIRECATINRGTDSGHGKTVMGSNCMVMAYAHVAHDCILGNNVIMANSVQMAGHVEVGNFVIISGMAALQQFLRIGDYAFLGGSSGYNLDIPPYMLAHGVRGKLYGPNLIGLKRNGIPKESIKCIKRAFKTIFRSGLKKAEGLAQVEAEYGDVPEIKTLLTFIRESKNGVAPGVTKGGNGS